MSKIIPKNRRTLNYAISLMFGLILCFLFFRLAPQTSKGVDIVLFSFDRPLQLYACLESIERHMTGYEQIRVIVRASDERFRLAYAEVANAFPHTQWIWQKGATRKDFKPLLMKALSFPSEYVVFGVDDIIVKDDVDLSFCKTKLEQTGAYGFFLRLGEHIQYCYQSKEPEKIPFSQDVGQGVFSWDFREAEKDWAFPNNLDMTLYRKKDFLSIFRQMKYKHPNSLEFAWAKKPVSNFRGLYFKRSKIVNIPLNVVSVTGNPHMHFAGTEELLVKFNEGLQFDTTTLYQVENSSPHYEWVPEMISRCP